MAAPTSALSDAFREHLRHRRVTDLAFFTFSFEPGFFEEEILSTFIDVGTVASEKVRLAMMEDELRADRRVAVYYDPGVLVTAKGSSRLPITRVPIRPPRGLFHPKNVLALMEGEEPDPETGRTAKHLLVATMSANATRAGWWENVEVAHLEVLSEGEPSSVAQDVRTLIDTVRKLARDPREQHEALQNIRRFVSKIEPITQRTRKSVVQTRVYVSGSTSIVDFLWERLGRDAVGLNLEIISPFFDQGDARVLSELIERFQPRETRLLLPRDAKGAACCTEEFFLSAADLPDFEWARLPEKLMSSGSAANARPRTVHAKVYRFFDPTHRVEYVFSGSPNLTSSAHSGKANVESGILVDTQPRRVPEWWTVRDDKKPKSFSEEAREDSGARESPLVALSLRYDWLRRVAEARWDASPPSPKLTLKMQTASFDLGPITAGEWETLDAATSDTIAERLKQTSFVEVSAPSVEPATLLVIEEGMETKPSLLLDLTTAEILKYWALLSPEQRAAFLQDRVDADDLPPNEREQLRKKLAADAASMFDIFASIFHAFGALERQVHGFIDRGELKALRARLFADRYDGLRVLLRRVDSDLATDGDAVRAYVIVLCALQLLDGVIERLDSDASILREARALREHVQSMRSIRDQIDVGSPEEREKFFKWFDRWFLKRAERRAA